MGTVKPRRGDILTVPSGDIVTHSNLLGLSLGIVVAFMFFGYGSGILLPSKANRMIFEPLITAFAAMPEISVAIWA